MERGVYFDSWYKHNHCYHPSLPLRTVQNLEDLERYHGTVLVWAGMGGGSISLPYLENEAFGLVDPRMQFYGCMNDRAFVEECEKRGIKLFGIVFEVQGWEIPAVFDEEGKLVKFNLYAQMDEQHDWYGLREFSQDKYPNAFRTSLKDYYPEGITNSLGETVTDLWEECCSRDMYGVPIHAQWVEVKNHKQTAYQMCRNNPVWRDYLKKIIAIQIDAGVQGIQLDECELPMTSIGSGGCFCKDCMREFTAYLKDLRAAGRLSAEWEGIDLDTFNYREYLLANNCTFPKDAPFFRDYWEFQVYEVRRYFSELVDFAKQYAKDKHGREVLVSGNFFNLQPTYYPIQPKADIIITEMEHSLFRQPHFYRYAAGFGDGKPVLIAENPYGGIVPELVELLDKGRGYDLYRVFMLEASVYGCNMTVPYGAWMGNTIKDAFWPPRSVTAQIQDFLYAHEDFYPKTPVKGAAVLYSYSSNYWRDAHRGDNNTPVPFWDVIRLLSAENAIYDVKMMPDGDFRPDDFKADVLSAYPMIILPDCWTLTQSQADIILDYAEQGGKVLVYGRLAENTDLAEKLKDTGSACFVNMLDRLEESREGFLKAFDRMYAGISTVTCTDPRLGLQRFDADGRTFVHLLNYDYDRKTDQIRPVRNVEVMLKELAGSNIRVWTLDGETSDFDVTREGDVTKVLLHQVPVYTVITAE